MISLAEFQRTMDSDGWVVFPGVVSPALVGDMLTDMSRAWDVCR